jgi:Ni/Co efflux regulator RcnB
MKRLISTALAAVLATGTIAVGTASADQYYGPQGFNHQRGYVPPGYHLAPDGGWNGWHRGGYYHGPRYVVRDYDRYHLRQPPRGYEWVQANGQFVLLAVTTGVIADILLNH